jgi:hypothetical protein
MYLTVHFYYHHVLLLLIAIVGIGCYQLCFYYINIYTIIIFETLFLKDFLKRKHIIIFIYHIYIISVRFQCKIVTRNFGDIYSRRYLLQKTGLEERTMVYVRKSCLAWR